MTFELIEPLSNLWENVKSYAAGCSWTAGKSLARDMDNHMFSGWERVIVALEGEIICGYCTVAKTDCIPDVAYTPYIGYLFIDEQYRGNRLSEKLILFAISYLRKIGFDKVYLVSDHENLYEKYGFSVVERAVAPWGAVEKIYRKLI